MNNDNKVVYGSFSTVEVNKEKLLDILKENKEKHNLIYNASLSGYYDKVTEWRKNVAEYAELQSDKYELASKSIENFAHKVLGSKTNYEYGKPVPVIEYIKIDTSVKKTFPGYPNFPMSYESSYNEAIKKLELSLHDQFQLSEPEFQKYVMNNWEWKQTFVNNSYNFLNNTVYITGQSLGSLSGCLASF